MLIELDFLLLAWVEDSDTRATIIEKHIFKIVENALQDRHIDVFAVEILMPIARTMMTGLENTSTDSPSGAIKSIKSSKRRSRLAAAINTGMRVLLLGST